MNGHNIQQALAKAHYVATEAQVEQLAAAQYTATMEVEGHNLTYLRVLVVGVQAQVGTKKRGRQPTVDAQLTVVENVHTKFYAAVLRGVTTPDVAAEDGLEPVERSRRALERNRRSTFARSAKTTLVNFVKGGGDIRGLDAATVSKASLRAAIKPPEPANRMERSLERSQQAFLRAINRMARGSPAVARQRLEQFIETLQARLEELPEMGDVGGETTTTLHARRDRGPARTRVGTPLLNRGA